MFARENLQNGVKLTIKGHPHGIKNGWFFWPVNFDPIWLENCDGFQSKEDRTAKGGVS